MVVHTDRTVKKKKKSTNLSLRPTNPFLGANTYKIQIWKKDLAEKVPGRAPTVISL